MSPRQRKKPVQKVPFVKRTEIAESFSETAVVTRDGTGTSLVGILDLIFIHGIPRRQESRAIKHSLSFDESAVRNVKGTPITAVYAV